MFKPQRMSKLSIVGPKTMQKKIVEKLYNLKVYHIVDHIKDEKLDIGEPFENADDISSLLIKIRAMISYFKLNTSDFSKDIESFRNKSREFSYKEGKRIVEKLYKSFTKNVSMLKDTDTEIKRKNTQIEKLIILRKLRLDVRLLRQYESLRYFTGYLNRVKGLEKDISSITNDFTLHRTIHGKRNIFALFVVKEKKEEVQKLLEKRGFTSIDFFDIKELNIVFLKGTVLEQRVKKLEIERKKINKEIESIKRNWSRQLVIYEDILTGESVKSEAPLRFASTQEAFFIKGWLPEKRVEKITEILNELTNNKIFIKSEPVTEEDDVPVELENPKLVSSFEFFMNLYALPKYKEIDPTFFIFLTFPLFFGFMLGDMGYGLVTLLLFWLLKKKIPKAKNFFNILMFASVATILFGALFGEVFGEEILFGYHLPNILSRAHQVTELLYVSIAIGAVHVNIGLLIGFYNELVMHGFWKAVFAKFSWFVLEAAIIIGIFYSTFYAIILGVISVIMLYLGEGVKGLVELPTLFSNMLSYSRLMAIGVASVQLALVINEFAREFFHKGSFFILAGIAILLVGHVINIALGILGPFLHSLRLHYVEFFTKFFEGGGKRYVPFGTKE